MGLENNAAIAAGVSPGMALSALTSMGGSIANYIGNKENNQANIDMQRETNAQNQANYMFSLTREDNAVQRRAGDLKQAGLSPVLAAGSAASSSSPIKIDSPHGEVDLMSGPLNNMIQGTLAASQVARTNADIKKTTADTHLSYQNANTSRANEDATDYDVKRRTIMLDFETKAIDASTMRNRLESARAKYELDRDKKFGLGEKSTGTSRQFQDIAAGLTAADGGATKKQKEAQKNPAPGSPGELWKKTKFGY